MKKASLHRLVALAALVLLAPSLSSCHVASRRAATKGEADAQFQLGARYDDGVGVIRNESTAAYWYRKAAEQGHAEAQNRLGYCLRYGEGVRANPAEGAEWFRKSAEQGFALAQYNLGDCYESGDGVRKSAFRATQWYRKAAAQGQPDAQCALACHYAWGISIDGDMNQAASLFRKAADQNHAEAQRHLARCYAMGAGVRQSDSNALYWYRRAAMQGDEIALYELAAMQQGMGTQQDDVALATTPRRWWQFWKRKPELNTVIDPAVTPETSSTSHAVAQAAPQQPLQPRPRRWWQFWKKKPAAAPLATTTHTAAPHTAVKVQPQQPKPRSRWWQRWKAQNASVQATPALAPAPKPLYHTVRKGDTLSHIARDHRVSIKALAAENGLNPQKYIIKPGQKLRVPGKTEPVAVPQPAPQPPKRRWWQRSRQEG